MNLDKVLAGWGFRTNRPAFEVGDELTAFLTDREGDEGEVRIGDTRLHVADVDGAHVDDLLRVRVTEFDAAESTGRAEILENFGGR